VVSPEDLQEVQLGCGGATLMTDGGREYIYLPALRLPAGCVPQNTEALLCLSEHSGYATRLFVSKPIPGRGANWTTAMVLGKAWHTWSWNGVPSSLRPMEILAEHLRGLHK